MIESPKKRTHISSSPKKNRKTKAKKKKTDDNLIDTCDVSAMAQKAFEYNLSPDKIESDAITLGE